MAGPEGTTHRWLGWQLPHDTRLCLYREGPALVLDATRVRARFGRGPENDLDLGDDFASRHHGDLVYRDAQFLLTDVSTNGTLVVRPNGHALYVHEETILLEGAGSLRLGHLRGAEIGFRVEVRLPENDAWHSPGVSTGALQEPSGDVFRLEGEYWTIRFDDTILRMKNAKGLQYIHHLLCHAGREVHVLDLAMLFSPVSRSGGLSSARMRKDEGLVATDGGDAGPSLDDTAKRDYKRRLAELRGERAEAERLCDAERLDQVNGEEAFIERELAYAVGLGGRDRPVASHAERARVMVTSRIRSALKKIGQCHPILGRHFTAAIRTGRYCTYAPDSTQSPTWTL